MSVCICTSGNIAERTARHHNKKSFFSLHNNINCINTGDSCKYINSYSLTRLVIYQTLMGFVIHASFKNIIDIFFIRMNQK